MRFNNNYMRASSIGATCGVNAKEKRLYIDVEVRQSPIAGVPFFQSNASPKQQVRATSTALIF